MFEHRSVLAFIRELATQLWASVKPYVIPYPIKPWSGNLRSGSLLDSDRYRRVNGFYKIERLLRPGLKYYGCTVGVVGVND